MSASRCIRGLLAALALVALLVGPSRAENADARPALGMNDARQAIPFVKHRPTLRVLSVGVSRYEKSDGKGFKNLSYAAKDARDVANVLETQEGKGYAVVESKVLLNDEATREAIVAELDRLVEQSKPEDTVIIFLSGHGTADHGHWYFLPYDVDPSRGNHMLPGDLLRERTGRMAGNVLLAINSCHSGALRAADNVTLLASCEGDQVSVEMGALRNGIYTKALVEALSGQADADNDGVVTLAEVESYVAERVDALIASHPIPESTIRAWKREGIDYSPQHVVTRRAAAAAGGLVLCKVDAEK